MNWVKIDDRLPEDKEPYVICYKDEDGEWPCYTIATYRKSAWSNLDSDYVNLKEVEITHWGYIDRPWDYKKDER